MSWSSLFGRVGRRLPAAPSSLRDRYVMTMRSRIIEWLLLRRADRSAIIVFAAFWLIGASAAETLDTVPEFEGAGHFKAIARASDGAWGAGWNSCSVTEAIDHAFAFCKDNQKFSGAGPVCRLTRLGDTNVAGLVGEALTESIKRYREEIEGAWLALSRLGGDPGEFLLYGGEAEGWDEFIVGELRSNEDALCMTYVEVAGAVLECTGYIRFVAYLHPPDPFPRYGEVVTTCTGGQTLRGEGVSINESEGFACLLTKKGDPVLIVFGESTNAIIRTRDAFLAVYNARVATSGLDRERCGWGLTS